MASKKCPKCGLYNADSAMRCDCGYRFAAAPALTMATAVAPAGAAATAGPARLAGGLAHRPGAAAVPDIASTEGVRFRRRAGAYMIDSIIYVASSYVVSAALGVTVGLAMVLAGRRFQLAQGAWTQWLDYGVGLVAMTLYFAIPEWLYGATLGKVMLGMRVVKVNGERCDFRAAIVRSIVRYIDGLFFGLVAYGSMKWPLYQRLGDKAAKTIVVDAHDAIIQQPRAWWWILAAAAIYLALDAGLLLAAFIVTLR